MKILISAYACEPNSGSESEIGWSWIKLHIKKRNKLYIVKLMVLDRHTDPKVFSNLAIEQRSNRPNAFK